MFHGREVGFNVRGMGVGEGLPIIDRTGEAPPEWNRPV